MEREENLVSERNCMIDDNFGGVEQNRMVGTSAIAKAEDADDDVCRDLYDDVNINFNANAVTEINLQQQKEEGGGRDEGNIVEKLNQRSQEDVASNLGEEDDTCSSTDIARTSNDVTRGQQGNSNTVAFTESKEDDLKLATCNNKLEPACTGNETIISVANLHWWTTDADLELVMSHYGRIKNMKFAEFAVNGQSKGRCQVEFFDHAGACKCLQNMNGYCFDGRPCTVTFASRNTIPSRNRGFRSRNSGGFGSGYYHNGNGERFRDDLGQNQIRRNNRESNGYQYYDFTAPGIMGQEFSPAVAAALNNGRSYGYYYANGVRFLAMLQTTFQQAFAGTIPALPTLNPAVFTQNFQANVAGLMNRMNSNAANSNLPYSVRQSYHDEDLEEHATEIKEKGITDMSRESHGSRQISDDKEDQRKEQSDSSKYDKRRRVADNCRDRDDKYSNKDLYKDTACRRLKLGDLRDSHQIKRRREKSLNKGGREENGVQGSKRRNGRDRKSCRNDHSYNHENSRENSRCHGQKRHDKISNRSRNSRGHVC